MNKNKKIDKKKYKKALDFTYKIHFKQNRKGTGIPYFTHLVSVVIISLKMVALPMKL